MLIYLRLSTQMQTSKLSCTLSQFNVIYIRVLASNGFLSSKSNSGQKMATKAVTLQSLKLHCECYE